MPMVSQGLVKVLQELLGSRAFYFLFASHARFWEEFALFQTVAIFYFVVFYLIFAKPSKSPKDCTRPGPHQPLTSLDFLGVSYWPQWVSKLGQLTDRNPWNPITLMIFDLYKGHGGVLLSTCVHGSQDHKYNLSGCNHMFNHYLEVSPWLPE